MESVVCGGGMDCSDGQYPIQCVWHPQLWES